jgi:hypothetical protein
MAHRRVFVLNNRNAVRYTAALIACFAACTPTNTEPVVDAVSVSPATKTIGINEDATLAASATAAGVVMPSQVFTWSSADQTIATVNSSGVVHGVSPGTVRIDATTAGHTGSMQLTVGNPAPVLQSISPSTVGAAGSAFTLTITGSGFVSGSNVYWNGSLRPTVFVSATTLTALITAADIAVQGSAQVSVVNPSPRGGPSSAATFVIVYPLPVVESISPSVAPVAGPAFTLTVSGTGFVPSSSVYWNGSPRPTTFVSQTSLRASIAATDIAAQVNAQVTVVNASPGGGTSSASMFTIGNPVPVVQSLIPSTTIVGGPAFSLTVKGAGFVSSSSVYWNGSLRPTVFVSATTLTASIAAADISAQGSAQVTVVNGAPSGGTSGAVSFSVTAPPAPAVTSVSPASIAYGGAAFPLTVTGSGFTAASVVHINGVARPTTFVSATSLTATIGSADITTIGSASITVANAGIPSNAVQLTISGGTPSLIKSIPMPTGATYHHDTFVRDGLAFVCAWSKGVLIYDVGNGMRGGSPSNPQLVSQIITDGRVSDLNLPNVHNAWWFKNPVTGENRYLFVGQEGPGAVATSSSGSIHIVDVSNISAPVEVGKISVAGAGVHNFWMDEANQILYAAYYNGGVIKVDVSGTLSGDMSSRIVAQVKPGGVGNTYIWGVMLANGTLYATDMVSGFWALDPATLATKGGGNNVPDQYGSDQWVFGNVAYSGGWGNRTGALGNGLKIWTLGGNGTPTLAGTLRVPNITTISDVAVTPDGKMLVLTAEGGSGNGLYVYDRTNPLAPVLAAWYPISQGLHTGEIAVINGRTYVFAARDPSQPQMDIFDITDVVH